jgi:hypothetical protein
MSRTMLARIAKLEASRPCGKGDGSFRLLWTRPGMDVQQQKAAMVAAGEAKEGEDFIVISFVRPGENDPRSVYSPEPEGWSR